MGSGLSPNGIGFSDAHIVTLEAMNEVLHVDEEKKQVTVQCGAQVGELVDHLADFGLTLQNLASINQQQLGGFIQVGAHGTGASIPPVEEQVIALEIETPGQGTLRLTKESGDPRFDMIKCGLGCFGVVTQITLQCVDAHKLAEDTFVLSQREVRQDHPSRLQSFRHARYMWLPYTGHAVEDDKARPTAPMVDLLREQVDTSKLPGNLASAGFGELRDWLLRAGPGPLDAEHVRRVNKAELEFWKRSEAHGVEDEASNVLAFDCGGQQLVLEVALPCGTLSDPSGRDLDFIDTLLKRIEKENFPAPAPIEQRWTCGSTAPMSPVHVPDKAAARDALFSWVGIIMYLPSQDPAERKAIEDKFYQYKQMIEEIDREGKFEAVTHWAKIEVPRSEKEVEQMQKKLRARYPFEAFERLRAECDPQRILTNDLIDGLFVVKA
ncbi:L-galactono-1,4-lactone dehydrogenase, mitochondrial [Hondaea fermentalgiana]|uniref:L-galactono-1,4-lactone dehydrogenase, mitochondrial n=1 Tax=Hondaea fermentalgiana TaxID=2315210 RepID=A0A2R5GII8_9STRA|nr:L-galactono-1,4-lactone dehydrogenase, mitochondrial [Hondaea fermentalgiana]|eukprot:GBG30707.1 L-galactono-1,4-lactone dehydrogenase, mitochondrial [Hondaea fermentalgiana]